MTDQEIIQHVKYQKWKGLHIIDDEKKGKKVMTSRVFKKGEVVCDYHGRLICKSSAQKLMEEAEDGEMGYLFLS